MNCMIYNKLIFGTLLYVLRTLGIGYLLLELAGISS